MSVCLGAGVSAFGCCCFQSVPLLEKLKICDEKMKKTTDGVMKKGNGHICLGQKHEIKLAIRQRVMKTEKNTKIAQVKYLMGIPAALPENNFLFPAVEQENQPAGVSLRLSVCIYTIRSQKESIMSPSSCANDGRTGDNQQSPPRRMFFFVFGGFFLVVGLLLVLTKHAALDRHLFSEQMALDAGITGTRDRFFHLAASRVQSRQHHLQLQSQNSSISISPVTKVPTISAAAYQSNERKMKPKEKARCQLSFPSKCVISKNLIPYWEETTDSCFVSPLRQQYGLQAANVTDRRYVVFQPDLGGWNNIRMALEVVILYALVTGRILVMPPHTVLYLLNGNKKWDANKSTMDDYLDFERMKAHDGLEVMEMDEFLTTVAGLSSSHVDPLLILSILSSLLYSTIISSLPSSHFYLIIISSFSCISKYQVQVY